MKGIITDIKRFAQHDGAGLRTTVFFQGCGLRCLWCHNPETQSRHPRLQFFPSKCVQCGACVSVCPSGALTPGQGFHREKCRDCSACAEACPTMARKVCARAYTVDTLLEKLLEDQPFYALGGGVTLSGGEPLLQGDFAVEIARRLWEQGISVDLDTCGFADLGALENIFPYVDVFLFDIKAIDSALHKKLTGGENGRILENLQYLLDRHAKVEIRWPYVPVCNDGEAEAIAFWLRGKPIAKLKVLGYHDSARSKYEALGIPDSMPRVALPTAEQIDAVVDQMRLWGIPAVNGMRED